MPDAAPAADSTLVEVQRPTPEIAVIVLRDPRRRNALSPEMGQEFAELCAVLAEDAGLRVVVLVGYGGMFSAGGTLEMIEANAARAAGGHDTSTDSERFYASFASVRSIGVPVIAAVEGAAIGAGLCLAILADLVVVEAEARVGFTFTRLGLHPGMLATATAVRSCGRARATELLVTGRVFSGTDAVDYGLALEAVPSGSVLTRARELADQVAASAPSAVRQLIETLREADEDFPAVMRREATCQAENFGGAELQEGLSALRERRPPHFVAMTRTEN